MLERGEVSAAELHRAYLDAAAERNDELNAYLCTVEDGADGASGVPIALKDVVSTKGVETTAGSKILAGYRPVFDATVATRCKEAGLSLLGKTNMDEFAMGSSTENSAYGPTRNPWDPTRVPGGSSGGSTAAVAAGLAPWALGSDTGGSIKQPAALCGVVGLRPTYGTVSRYGIVAFASSLDQIGPIAKTVRDCALLYRIIAGRDANDTTTVELPEPVELPEAEDLEGLRIGVPVELNEAEGIEPGVTAEVERALEVARELGAEIGECSLPRSVEFGLPCYYLIAPSEASSNLARYDGVRYGLRSEANGDIRAMYDRTRHDGFGDEPKRRIMLGTYALSAGYYEAFYGQAQKVRTVIREEHAAAFEQFDVLVSPTSPTVAFELGARTAEPARDVRGGPAHDPVEPRRPARALDPVRALGRAAGRPPADRAAVLGEPPLPRRPRARARNRLRLRPGAVQVSVSWEPVIGLEIHVHLKTQTKMFCRCRVAYFEPPNTQTCPVCLAFPGRCRCRIARRSSGRSGSGWRSAARSPQRAVFHRKNYFYPDNPEGLPDLPVRRAALRRRARGRARPRRRHGDRDRAGPSRGGRGEDRSTSAARKAVSTAPRAPSSTSTARGRRLSRS